MLETLAVQTEVNDYLRDLDKMIVPKKKSKFGYVSLFCGGGGLDLGFALSGFRPLFSTDIEETCCKTIQRNLFGHVCEVHCMTELSGDYVLSKTNREIDLVLGGPPCQSFSILGDRKAIDDPRGQLVFEFVRFLREVKPKAFLFENVPGILSVNGGRDWNEFLKFLQKEMEYDIKWKKMNAANFGVPQIRERVLVVGFKKKAQFQWPTGSHSVSDDDLLAEPARASWLALENTEGLPNHVLREHSTRVMKRYSKVKPGKRDQIDHTDRIHPEYPSGTVLVGSGAGGGRPFIHPYEHRHITVREAARLQSFPDWWVFEGGPTASYRQVGNAVPPLFAREIANSIMKSLKTM